MEKRKFQLLVLALLALCLVSGIAMSAGTKSLAIATGGTGGTYYPLGYALAKEISERTGILATAQTGNASVANCNLVTRGDVETAFVQNNVAYEAYNGLGTFKGKPAQDLRAIAALYPEIVQVVARKAAGVINLKEARGKLISVGDKGSGTEVDARNILGRHGLTYDDIQPLYFNFSVSAQKLQNDQCDVLFTTAGVPTSSIIELMTGKECNFVSLDPIALNEFCAQFPFYVPITIAPGTYKNQTEPVNTVAMMALWITSSNFDNDSVYKITKALWAKRYWGGSGADALARIHNQGKNIKLETALKGVTIPLHPGAEKFYKEVGLIKP